MRRADNSGTISLVDDSEAAALTLEALFDIKAMVAETHRPYFDDKEMDDGEAEEDARRARGRARLPR